MDFRIFTSFLLLSMLLLSACEVRVEPPATEDGNDGQELKKFQSKQEILEFLDQAGRTVPSYGAARGLAGADMVMEAAEAKADDFSTTNVQVQGVDEADFVKNDGKHIYLIAQDKLVIVDAYPAEDAEIISETEIKARPRNMLLKDDRLVIFTDDYEDTYVISEYDYVPRRRPAQKTHALIYDISDRENPELIEDYSLNGNYFESRMIDEYVYFVVKEDIYYYNNLIDLPVIREKGGIAVQPEIYYFDNPEDDYIFHTIAGFDIFGSTIDAKTFMMGYSNSLYVSKGNIYIAYQKNIPWIDYRARNEERFYNVVLPLLPADARSEIISVKNDNSISSYQRWDRISLILEDMYNNMDEDDKQDLIQEIEQAVEEYEAKMEAERRKTVIHKISIDDGKIEYRARGEVEGYLLNQFSMDEYEDNLRVATTTYIYRQGSTMYNNVYVLDHDLDVIGKIEDIAPEERIYSARFIGERLYMVTFKNIDPFFVVDLSDPKKPEILGELKIPGFSDYLHPYDEDHIIGIGKETEGNQWGGVSTGGVKIALFDVSDVENPKQVDKYEIGEPGTDSEALRDHKAFLFDRKRNLLVIPVREVTGRFRDPKYGYYRNSLTQGAYVFGIDPNGISLRGKVIHEEDASDRWYWNSPDAVRRSLYMDDVLYTVSAKTLKMNEIDGLDEIDEISLPYSENSYNWY